jgi:hypothetical protein
VGVAIFEPVTSREGVVVVVYQLEGDSEPEAAVPSIVNPDCRTSVTVTSVTKIVTSVVSET